MDLFNFVQGKPSYSLTGNGVGSSDTSVTVSDFTLPDGTNITMSMFGDTGYGTFEPGTAREENISFAGVTQNANGTATLTGVTRGLRFVAPYTADSGLAKGHGGNTPFVLSNSAPFYNELSGKDNDETITGTWTFTSPNYPRIDDANNVATLDPQFVTKKMLDDTAFAGANLNKIVVPGVAGETVAENNILYFDETDEEWKLADATFVNQESYLIGLAMGAGTDGNGIDGGVMLEGVKGSFTGLSAGEPIFLSDTPGEISTSAGTIQVELGYVQTASTTEILFFPKFKSYLLADTKDALNNPTSGGTLSSTNPVVDDNDTATTSTADAVVRGDGSGKIDGGWLNGTTRVINAGETINGSTLAVPVYIDTADSEAYSCDANDTTKLKFVGFAVTDGTDGNPITIQTNGIVNGFSALTPGSKYYVQDTVGTIGASPGTAEVLVGVAITPTQIAIQKGSRYSSGTTTFSTTTTTTITTGFRVSKVRISGTIPPSGGSASLGKGFSNGGWTVAGGNNCIFGAADGDNGIGAATNAYRLVDDGGSTNVGNVQNITETTFDIANTATSSPNNSFIFWEAFGEL